jgi:hypothetical protein
VASYCNLTDAVAVHVRIGGGIKPATSAITFRAVFVVDLLPCAWRSLTVLLEFEEVFVDPKNILSTDKRVHEDGFTNLEPLICKPSRNVGTELSFTGVYNLGVQS